MIASQLIKQIKATKGKIVAPIHWAHGTMHVVVEKKDLVLQIGQGDHETGYHLYELEDGTTCFGADHNVD